MISGMTPAGTYWCECGHENPPEMQSASGSWVCECCGQESKGE